MKEESYLRNLARFYVEEAVNEGFTEEQLYFYILCEMKRAGRKAEQQKQKEEIQNCKKEDQETLKQQPISLIEISKEEYFELASLALRKKEGKRRVPGPTHLNQSLKVLYFIHEKKYNTLEEYNSLLKERLNVYSTSVITGTLGRTYNLLYSGLWSFAERYISEETVWKESDNAKRLQLLEAAEKRMYADMLVLREKRLETSK